LGKSLPSLRRFTVVSACLASAVACVWTGHALAAWDIARLSANLAVPVNANAPPLSLPAPGIPPQASRPSSRRLPLAPTLNTMPVAPGDAPPPPERSLLDMADPWNPARALPAVEPPVPLALDTSDPWEPSREFERSQMPQLGPIDRADMWQ